MLAENNCFEATAVASATCHINGGRGGGKQPQFDTAAMQCSQWPNCKIFTLKPAGQNFRRTLVKFLAFFHFLP